MPITDFNINPWYDDYDPTKGFHRILYVPERAVQARELTQQQTILQNQIERFANHVFEDGSVVTGGEHFLDLDVTYLKLEEQFAGQPINVENYAGQLVVGQTSGAVGRVIHVESKTSTDEPVLFVKIETGIFVDGETIVAQDTLASATLIATSATGKSSVAAINEGVYYVNGFFVLVNSQLIILDKFSNTPSYRIGLTVVESVVTHNDDPSLLDNAAGSPNHTASGADRFKIDLVLEKKSLDFEDEIDNSATSKYIEFLRVVDGIRIKDVDYNIYSNLEDNLARRTFDESGNYTVEPFQIELQDDPIDEDKILVGLEAGKAFIRGYEHRTISTETIQSDKGRDTQEVNNSDINAQYGNYAIVTDVHGIFDATELPEVNLLSSDITGTNSGNFGTNTIGTARLRVVSYHAGTSVPMQYKMYLFDFQFNTGFSFKDVNSIWFGGFSNDVKANIDTTDGQDLAGNSLLFGTAFNKLIFATPNKAVQTLRPEGNTDTDIITNRSFDVSFSSGIAAINVSGTNSFFGATGPLSNDIIRQNYIVMLDTVTNAGGTGLSDGDILDMTVSGRSVTLSSGNQVATFDADDASFAATATILATVNLNEKGERVKTLNTQNVTGVTLDGNGVGDLGYSDVFSIVQILDSGDSNAVVTDKFDFDTGQRDNFYDHGSITLKDGESVVGPLEVDFEYFAHSGSGYFSVDSYTSAIDYEDIPTYTSSDGSVFDLRDVLDFRPRRIDNSTEFNIPVSGIDLPKPNTNVNADYIFYIPRIDKVVLRSNREFDIIKGVASLNPVTPADDEDAMTLYILKVPAYTFNVDDIEIEYVDNRRYTMQDIGLLDKRLNTVEYYTALTLLEKETQDLTILDDLGIEQFKSGILVDSFNGHGVGDVINTDYKCSIDFSKRELRPSFNEDLVDFQFNSVDSTNVQLTGDLVTLDYTESDFLKQILSNTTVNVNPFAISSWRGTMKLSPETDNWFDTVNNPKVITNVQGENDAWRAPNLGFGTQWNSWIDNWAGKQLREEDLLNSIGNNPISRDALKVSESNSRQNLRSSFSPQSIQRQVGTRAVNESIVPFIEMQDVTFNVRGMKRNTTVYPFFDGVDVSAYCKPDGGSFGDALVTDQYGAISGTFQIPNEMAQKFKTGERLFRLTDSSTNDLSTTTTTAERRFVARGLIESREQFFVSSRAPILSRKTIEDKVLLRDPVTREQISSSNALTEVNWHDPLAQTFMVDSNVYKNGLFVSSLDLYFLTKDANVPVTIEIRPTVNGYPHSSLAVPFSQVTLNPNEINISEDGSIATHFTFDAPVYLPTGNYALIITSNSNEYQVFVGEQGQNVTNTAKRITRQPHILQLFKAQNIQNYTGEDDVSLKFKLNRCEFESVGTAVLNNIQPDSDILADLIYILTSQFKAPDTNISFSYKIKDVGTGNISTSWIPVITDKNHKFLDQKIIEAATADTLMIRAEMTSNDSSVSPIVDLERFGVVAIENKINNDVTNEDLSFGGNALAKYITRRVTLEDGFDADGLRVFLTALKTSQTDIKVYYKVLSAEDGSLFDNRPWVEIDQVTQAGTISVNENDFKEFEFGVDDVEYDGFTDFNRFAIKIVMTSTDTTQVPVIRDMRAIALRS